MSYPRGIPTSASSEVVTENAPNEEICCVVETGVMKERGGFSGYGYREECRGSPEKRQRVRILATMIQNPDAARIGPR
jgi:hypothetical protein